MVWLHINHPYLKIITPTSFFLLIIPASSPTLLSCIFYLLKAALASISLKNSGDAGLFFKAGKENSILKYSIDFI
jgi:hypothetical protein